MNERRPSNRTLYFAANCVFLSLLWVALAGCGAARQVYRDQSAGVVAIPVNSNRWPNHYRQTAEQLMADHFPDGYEIVREEETIVGQTTTFSADQSERSSKNQDANERVASKDTTGRVTTRDNTEYRIHYRRR